MQQTRVKPQRNLSMECYKLVASFFIVFTHAMFPGSLGKTAECISRCGVHVFFAITGYFNFGASSKAIARRLKHILKIYVSAIAIYVFWCCLKTELLGGSSVAALITLVPDPDETMRWLILQMDPFVGSLWYVNSTVVCYAVFWIYTRFFGEEPVNYKPMYMAGFSIFAMVFYVSVLAPAAGTNAATAYPVIRNAWCWGIPMFTFGVFVREYQQRIVENFRLTAGKLVLMTAAGFLLALAQLYTIGIPGMPLGLVIVIIGLVILLAAYPQVRMKTKAAQWLVPKFGFYSTVIYIIHGVFVDCYEQFLHQPMLAVWGEREGYLFPLVVLGLSIVSAVVAERAIFLLHSIPLKKKKQ